jgi:hypothetical protein
MKRSLIPVLTGLGLCFAQIAAHAQEFKQHISKEVNMQKGQVAICNLNGSIKVEGYAGDKVLMEIDETVTGDDLQALEDAKKEFKLGFDQKADTLIAYTAEPYDTRPHRERYSDENYRHVNYSVKLNYTVKVPFNSSLYASTVNSGHISVKDVYGTLKINNVNGAIEILNAKGTTNARTVNGALTATYLSIPPDASSYYTLNGELIVTYPPGLSADVEFKSMNGQFYTDFENTQVMPGRVVKTESKNGANTVYKLNKNEEVRFGTGGKVFKFETLNGNIYIKKQK